MLQPPRFVRRVRIVVSASILVACAAHPASENTEPHASDVATTPSSEARAPRSGAFERHVLSTEFFGEGASFADFDRDGHNDIVSGPYWYRGPEFKERHEIFEPKAYDPAHYSNDFFAFPYDFDGDGWTDVLVVGFPGQDASWFENPRGADKRWERHVAFAIVDNESPTFVDLFGDGKRELVCSTAGRLGWAAPDARDPRQPWTFHALSEDMQYGNFTHGLGVGDVDGDGRADVLTKDGWWRQPASLSGDPPWERHPFEFAEQGGAQMFTYDVDGDGDMDVITSKAAHGFGLSWWEQVKKDGAISFVEHTITGATPAENAQGVCFAEIHALALCDVDGDGLLDIVTGKRWWSHGAKGDPELGSPAVLYWFQLKRGPDQGPGGVEWIAHRIDDDSGVGTQVVAGDVDGDGRADVVVGNKHGTFVFLQRAAKPAVDDPNLGLEHGDLAHWHATGDAFVGQPIYGDTASGRGREPSKYVGNYWIGGYEKKGDTPTGTLASDPFTVTAPWASFLVGGGHGAGERVELWDEGASEPFFRVNGAGSETMQRAVVDLRSRSKKRIFIRLVDEESGGWGHINFDDFRFHEEKPVFPQDPAIPPLLPWDPPKHAGLSPADAAHAMTVPEGFHVDVIAAEPDLQQPIAFTIDPKGRIWIAEAFSYPSKRAQGQGKDQILVLEDKDHDGTFETRTVFATGLNLVSGLEVGFGGAWVGQAPELLFIPDRNDDLVPDGPPEVVLDGFGYDDTHETLNAFTWGPDGWLYGCHGVFTHSRVGAPGTPDDKRVPIDAGIWRLNPHTKKFEVFAWGTSNPWGIDFDAHGQAFCTACVIPHLFHVIQGARYERQAGSHFDKYVFEDIKTIADHRHYVGSDQWAANGRSDAVGGGHAHAGAMIYQGGAFPHEYDGQMFMGNIHGNRLNVDLLERKGSGFVAHHGKDFLLANDSWFRPINEKYGPDGAVYLIDWYDAQPCHLTDVDRWDRTNGRLYRIRYGEMKPYRVDLRALSSGQLVALQRVSNEWFAREARLVLAERGPDEGTAGDLQEMFLGSHDEELRLRLLWALHVMDSDAEVLEAALQSGHEHVAAWAVQLACENGAPSESLGAALRAEAQSTRSPVVALALASAIQRLPIDLGKELAEVLVTWGEDADDPNLPLMLWFGIEPLVAKDPSWGLGLARNPRLTKISAFIARRLASETATRESIVAETLREPNGARKKSLFHEISVAVADEHNLPMPPSWPALYEQMVKTGDAKLADAAFEIAVAFGDAHAFPKLRPLLADAKADLERRRHAMEVLARGRDSASLPAIEALLDDAKLRKDSLTALASFDATSIAPVVLAHWSKMSTEERAEALTTLAGRPSSARALLEAVKSGTIARTDVSAYVLRTLENLKDERVSALLTETIGIVHRSSAERLARIAELKQALPADVLAKADRLHGRDIFARTCSQCHTLFGSGGTLAPDLTGSNRRDMEYLLSNIVDPSAVIPKDYQVTMLWLKDERLVTGIVKRRTDTTIVMQSETGSFVIAKEDVAEEKLSNVSTMPDGLLDVMRKPDIADLVAYVQGEAQVARRVTRENASLFDGKTLAGWTGATTVWSVAPGGADGSGGEIVGKTSGLTKNEFLVSDLELADFRLIVELRLINDDGNSGVQFRTQPIAGGEVKGYQADVGPGWWGKIYEENGRGIVSDRSGESAVIKDGWNRYEIVAVGHHVMTALNGVVCADMVDEKGDLRGIVALQVHSGGATEVRFRKFALELDPKPELTTLIKH